MKHWQDFMGGILSSGFVFPPSPTCSIWFHSEERGKKRLNSAGCCNQVSPKWTVAASKNVMCF